MTRCRVSSVRVLRSVEISSFAVPSFFFSARETEFTRLPTRNVPLRLIGDALV
jgi:hypothetical protein